jgi:hypothetical protein
MRGPTLEGLQAGHVEEEPEIYLLNAPATTAAHSPAATQTNSRSLRAKTWRPANAG